MERPGRANTHSGPVIRPVVRLDSVRTARRSGGCPSTDGVRTGFWHAVQFSRCAPTRPRRCESRRTRRRPPTTGLLWPPARQSPLRLSGGGTPSRHPSPPPDRGLHPNDTARPGGPSTGPPRRRNRRSEGCPGAPLLLGPPRVTGSRLPPRTRRRCRSPNRRCFIALVSGDVVASPAAVDPVVALVASEVVVGAVVPAPPKIRSGPPPGTEVSSPPWPKRVSAFSPVSISAARMLPPDPRRGRFSPAERTDASPPAGPSPRGHREAALPRFPRTPRRRSSPRPARSADGPRIGCPPARHRRSAER